MDQKWMDPLANVLMALRYRSSYDRRLERWVRAMYLAGETPWFCCRCHRYTRTRVGLALHILAC